MGAVSEVIVIGGGIVGCMAAAELAARDIRVTLVERASIAAGASGRNLGAIQHPFDPELAALHHDSLDRYRSLASADAGFDLPPTPAGLLLLHSDAAGAARSAARLAAVLPELRPTMLDAADLAEAEPSLVSGLCAVRLDTGFPVPPAAATSAFARLAEARGAALRIGTGASPAVRAGRVEGVVLDDGDGLAADAVLVAAGPSSPALVDPSGGWRPIHPTWGVTVQLRLGDAAPSHIIEEDEVDTVNRPAAATARAAEANSDADPPTLFSVASADGVSTVGSTFLPSEPDADRIVPLLLRRGAGLLPAIADAPEVGRRVCARPQSVDGHPFIGPVPGVEGLYVCAGHGPWGISTGPGSAHLAVQAILDPAAPIPTALRASRSFPTA